MVRGGVGGSGLCGRLGGRLGGRPRAGRGGGGRRGLLRSRWRERAMLGGTVVRGPGAPPGIAGGRHGCTLGLSPGVGRHNPKTRICAKCFAFAFP